METTLIGGFTAPEILKKDHRVIKDLFRQFDDASSDQRKKELGDRCLREIEAHYAVEEKIFYPAVRRDLGEDRLVARAQAELEAAKRVVRELKNLEKGDRYNSRFDDLKEKVARHIDEDETHVLPRVERSDMDVEQVGRRMLARKILTAPNRMVNGGARTIAAVALGAAVIGGVAYLVRRLGGERNPD